MDLLRDVTVGGLLALTVATCAWAAPPQPAGTRGAAAPSTRPAPLRAEAADVEQVPRLTPGAALNFSVYGAAGASAQLKIDGAARPLALREVAPGIYEGTYTVGHADRIRPSSAAVATLRRGNEVARIAIDEPLQLGAARPAPAAPTAAAPRVAAAPAAEPAARSRSAANARPAAAKPPPPREDAAQRTARAAPAGIDGRPEARQAAPTRTATAAAPATGRGPSVASAGPRHGAAPPAPAAIPGRGAEAAPTVVARAGAAAAANAPARAAAAAPAGAAVLADAGSAAPRTADADVASSRSARADATQATPSRSLRRDPADAPSNASAGHNAADAAAGSYAGSVGAGVAPRERRSADVDPLADEVPASSVAQRVDLPPAVPDRAALALDRGSRSGTPVPSRERCVDCDSGEPVRPAPACSDCAVVESIRRVAAADPRPGGLRGLIERRMQHHREMFGRLTGRPPPADPSAGGEAPAAAYEVVFRLPDGARQVLRFDHEPPFAVGRQVRLLDPVPARAPRTLAAF